MSSDVIVETLLFMMTTVIGFIAGCNIEYKALESKLNAVGIKEVRYCSVDTPNASSNWYEIVWIDGKEHK